MGEWGTTERTRYPGIFKVTRGKTERYVVSFRVRGLGQRTKTFERLGDAREFQGRMRDPEQVSRLRKLEQGRVTLTDYFPLWLDRKRRLAESTHRRYADVGRIYIAPSRLGHTRLSDITRDSVEDWITEMQSRGVPAPTIDKCYRTLRACLSSAEREGKVLANPARAVETPEQDHREPFFLTAEQVDAIAQEVTDRHRALVYFLAYTGARIGEATALRVKNLDLVRRQVTIAENAPEVAGKKLEPGKTKNGKVRTVPIFEGLVEQLADHLDRYGRRDADGDLDREGFVFTSAQGTPIRQNNWRTRVLQAAALRANVTRAGRDGEREPPRVHDLRHTFASLAAANGYTLHEVKEMLGHSTINITSQFYLHLFPDQMAAKAERLGTAMREAREKSTASNVVPLAARK